MKRALIVFCTVIILLFAAAPGVLAQGSEVTIVIDSRRVESDVSPFIDNGRVLLPVRAIFEALSGEVHWDAAARRVTGFKGAKSVDLYIGQKEAKIAGNKTVLLDVPAQIVGGRTFVPVRFIAESLGSTVEWDGAKRVVRITTSKTPVVQDIADLINPRLVVVTTDFGFGSGFFWNEDGEVVTAAHVIDEAEWIKVRTSDKEEYNAEVVKEDSIYDLAIIKIVDGDKEFPYIQWSASDEDVSVGEQVVAMGSPKGFENTTSTGVVSAKRDIEDIQYYQSDAAISPGSSGGPLLDYFGRVIGVNTLTYIGGQNLNFAVPIDFLAKMEHRPDERRKLAYTDFIKKDQEWLATYIDLTKLQKEAYDAVDREDYDYAIEIIENTLLPGWDALYTDILDYEAKSEEIFEVCLSYSRFIGGLYLQDDEYLSHLVTLESSFYSRYIQYYDENKQQFEAFNNLRDALIDKYQKP